MSDPGSGSGSASGSGDSKFDVGTSKTHVFRVHKKVVHCLEIEDVLFHHGSAVLMPAGMVGEEDQNRISGLAVIRAAYMHAADNPDQKLLIAGHTDTTGSDSVNEKLSRRRAESVLHVLEGAKAPWVKIAKDTRQEEDIPHILTWAWLTFGWPCDPITDHAGDEKEAIRAFQKSYTESDFGSDIKVDGIVGDQTWGAVFDTYMARLRQLTESDDLELAELRGQVKWLYAGRKSIGCGEYHPLDSPYLDDHKSQVNRRVELLFYDPDEAPAKEPGDICHAGGKKQAEHCLLFNPKLYRFERVVPKDLEIRKCDDHFASGAESLEVTYRIEGLAPEKVTFMISSSRYSANPIFLRELTADEKTDGVHTIAWDGLANCKDGKLKDRFIHPLLSPYTVHLRFDTKYVDTAPFKVLYHSVTIQQGAWTPDEAEPKKTDEKKWVQYKLNEIGYYGGPVGADFDDYLKKAVIRYKANHKSMHELDYSDYDDSITATLKSALDKNENKRNFLTTDAFTDPAKESKILVESLTYEDGEFSDSKHTKETGRLNRPLIPVEAAILLKKKDGAAVSSPRGVGPVRVSWRFVDPDEDLTPLPTSTAAEPSLTRKYVEKCLKLKSGRTGTNGDNSHEDFGGVRQAPATNWKTPAVLGTKLAPFDVKTDDTQKVIHCEACTDADKFPKRLGKAGFFFRPSSVAGDDYKITAEIDFTGLPNQADLESFHGVTDASKRPKVETGTFRVWRFGKIAVQVNWPARTNSSEWAKIRTEYLQAYLDVDVGSIATKAITDVITEAEYKAIVASNTSHKKKDIRLKANSLVGVNLPAQGSLSASKYRAALKTFTNDDYWNKIYKDLRKKVSEKLRKDYPNGFVVVDFLTHLPVNIQTNPPANTTVSGPNTNYVTWTFSIGLPDSVIFADQKDPDKVYYVVAHEMGHNYWLKHWEHAGGSRSQDHDQADQNCIMSYSNSTCAHAHHRPGTYTPHFCGQCNLKLRGWNIDDAGIPANSS